MHPNAYALMQSFAESLPSSFPLKILDVGSKDSGYDPGGVPPTNRPLFDKAPWTYIGADLEGGPNVDLILPHPYRYPFESNSFDVVVSNQTLEHVQEPWTWALELARVTAEYLCIVTPWSWPEHRFPVDCWRILPDGMRHLLGKVCGLKILRCEMVETDVIGVATKRRR